jgi:hypothetical protein
MDRLRKAKKFVDISADLPKRRGRRPITIRGPIHVQCGEHGDERRLRAIVEQVTAWPHVEAGPLPIGSANFLSLQLAEDSPVQDSSVFISGREFGRVLLGSPTIYLTLPLQLAHWAIVRGWAEPHFFSSFGVMPPGVMVVYTPRDEYEVAVCRSLVWVSYDFSLNANKYESAETNLKAYDLTALKAA